MSDLLWGRGGNWRGEGGGKLGFWEVRRWAFVKTENWKRLKILKVKMEDFKIAQFLKLKIWQFNQKTEDLNYLLVGWTD